MESGERAAVRDGEVRVRRATVGDEAIVRSLRLQALFDAPDAFDSTLDRELTGTTSDWRRWFSQGATFILEHSSGPKGIVAGVPHRDGGKVAFLVSMWVHAELRGSGVADVLVEAVLCWAEDEGFAEVWLHVDKRNDGARRFYERNGFRVTGREIIRERDGVPELEMCHGLGGRDYGTSHRGSR